VKVMIDHLDDKIIDILKKDSRKPFVEIANELNVSEGTIRSRVKKLFEDGVIQSFTIKTSSKNVKAIIEVKIDVNVNTSDVASRISKYEGVSEVYEVTGEEDIVAIIDVTSSPQLNDIIEVKIDVNVNTSDVASRISKYEGVSEVYEVTGEEDIVAIIDVTSSPQLNDIIEQIRRFDNVQSTRTRLILKEHFGGI
jgi:Lrp/AsnC family transcriptional regulator for asnA, asnC and gidA